MLTENKSGYQKHYQLVMARERQHRDYYYSQLLDVLYSTSVACHENPRPLLLAHLPEPKVGIIVGLKSLKNSLKKSLKTTHVLVLHLHNHSKVKQAVEEK